MNETDKTAYSKDGYIVDQAKLKHIRYGLFTSDFNGCGWIAAFNFLKRMGEQVTERALADELIRFSLFRGLAGTDLGRLKRTLKRHGYRIPLLFRWNKKARLPEGTSAGLFYYWHKDGPHYVTFYADASLQPGEEGETRYRFLNAFAGKENHFDTMRSFLTKNNILPFALILAWTESKDDRRPSAGRRSE
jgi:hypothetical protein